MGKRTGGKRGAPFGNTNRLVHGRYSAARIARRKAVNAKLRQIRAFIARTKAVLRQFDEPAATARRPDAATPPNPSPRPW